MKNSEMRHTSWSWLRTSGLILLCIVAACASPTVAPSPLPTATSSLPEIELSFYTIERDDLYWTPLLDFQEPRLVVISQPTDIEPLVVSQPTVTEPSAISVDAQKAILALDFDRYFSIVAFQGLTGHYMPKSGVEIQKIVRQGNTIEVLAVFYGPVEGYEMHPIDNMPYHVVAVERESDMHGEFLFKLIVDGTERARQRVSLSACAQGTGEAWLRCPWWAEQTLRNMRLKTSQSNTRAVV